MLDFCKKRFPSHEWILNDIKQLNLDSKFDAIVAWGGACLHLPHEDQLKMFPLFAKHAKNGTMLLFTSGHEHDEIISQMDGHDFYHASLSEEEYRALLPQHGFEILIYRPQDNNCGQQTIWLAKYTGGNQI